MANEFVVKNGLITPNIKVSGSTSGTTTIVAYDGISGTLTLPAGTDTIVGEQTSATLANKSISGSTNTLTNIPNSALTNSSIKIGDTTIALGSSTTKLSWLDSASPNKLEFYGKKSPKGTVTSVTAVAGTENISFSNFWMGGVWQGTGYGNSLALLGAMNQATIDKLLAIPVGSTVTANDGLQTYSGTVTSVVNQNGYVYINMSNMSPDAYFTLYGGYVTIPAPTTALTLDATASAWWRYEFSWTAVPSDYPFMYAGTTPLLYPNVKSVTLDATDPGNPIATVTLAGQNYSISSGDAFGTSVATTSNAPRDKALIAYSSLKNKPYAIGLVDNFNWTEVPSWVIECPYDYNYNIIPPSLNDGSTLLTSASISNYALGKYGGTLEGSLTCHGAENYFYNGGYGYVDPAPGSQRTLKINGGLAATGSGYIDRLEVGTFSGTNYGYWGSNYNLASQVISYNDASTVLGQSSVGLAVINSNQTNQNFSTIILGSLDQYGTRNTQAAIYSINRINNSTSDPQGGLGIATAGSNNALIERMRFSNDGSVNVPGALKQGGNQVLHAGNYSNYSPSLTGTGASGTWGISVTGSAATLATARTLTIGNTGKTFNGSANVSWSLAEIGAAASANAALTTPTITGTREAKVAMAANDISLSSGNYFTKTISGATSLTVSSVPAAGTAASFILDLTNGGSATITWWAGMKWSSGAAPTLTASGRDVLGFFTHDGGATWTGLVLGKDVK